MLGGWVSYWMIPLFSAVVWIAMLLTMLLYWVGTGRPHYVSMDETQTIAYISDVGADMLKPLFISMGAVSVVTFDLVFIAEQYLRSIGRLTQNTRNQKIWAWLSILCAIVGAAGLILLSTFDTKHHPTLHNIFLALFIGGYVISAVFTCIEYQRLAAKNRSREDRILRFSFWIKLVFILLEVALAIAFGVLNRKRMWNDAAIVEWVIALVYTFYVASFALDFRPATKTARRKDAEKSLHDEVNEAPTVQAGMARDEERSRYGANPDTYYSSDTTLPSGHVNGGAYR